MYLLCHSIQNDVNPSSSFGFVKAGGIEVNFQSKILAEMPYILIDIGYFHPISDFSKTLFIWQ